MTILARRRLQWFGLVVAAMVAAPDGRAACVSTCGHQLAACKRSACAGKRGRDRRRCVADCVGGTGCVRGGGTLAYVVTACHEEGTTLVGSQELRILRGGCDPVIALRFANPEPVSDLFGLCGMVAKNHSGFFSPIAGVFQRLAVTPDGTGVIFEVSNAFELIGKTALADDQQGFFYVRADGTGLRRLGTPSRDPVYRIRRNDDGSYSPELKPQFGVSDDGSKVVYTDLGLGSDGTQQEQLVVLFVATGERRQVTHFPTPESPLPSGHRIMWPGFSGEDAVSFVRRVGQDGKDWKFFWINLDGTGLTDGANSSPSDPKVSSNGTEGRVEHSLKRTSGRLLIGEKSSSQPSERPDIWPGYGQVDLFADVGDQFVQLTDFHLFDTALAGIRSLADSSAARASAPDVMFMASADPLGENPDENCNLFRITALGTHLRQLTHFGEGARSVAGCGEWLFGVSPGCGIDYIFPDIRPSGTFVFYSDCDPFGTNPDGSQAFMIDFAGRLRQLAHTAGARHAPDGSIDVEIPGPVARGGFALW